MTVNLVVFFDKMTFGIVIQYFTFAINIQISLKIKFMSIVKILFSA